MAKVWGEKRVEGGGRETAWYCARVDGYLVGLVLAEVERALGLVVDGVEEAGGGGRVDIRWRSSDGVSSAVMDQIERAVERVDGDLRRFVLYLEAARKLAQHEERRGEA